LFFGFLLLRNNALVLYVISLFILFPVEADLDFISIVHLGIHNVLTSLQLFFFLHLKLLVCLISTHIILKGIFVLYISVTLTISYFLSFWGDHGGEGQGAKVQGLFSFKIRSVLSSGFLFSSCYFFLLHIYLV